MGRGNNDLMLGVLTERVFEILFSEKSSLGTQAQCLSFIWNCWKVRNIRMGSTSNIPPIIEIFSKLS